MSRPVNPTRLNSRRQYDGCIYAQAGARPVTRAGAEWIQMIALDGLRLEVVGDGSLAAYQGATLRFEIYETPQLREDGYAPN
jgi:hypothetical protein